MTIDESELNRLAQDLNNPHSPSNRNTPRHRQKAVLKVLSRAFIEHHLLTEETDGLVENARMLDASVGEALFTDRALASQAAEMASSRPSEISLEEPMAANIYAMP